MMIARVVGTPYQAALIALGLGVSSVSGAIFYRGLWKTLILRPLDAPIALSRRPDQAQTLFEVVRHRHPASADLQQGEVQAVAG